MELLEREHQLADLGAWSAAASDAGRLAVISGPAGIGKTSLVELLCGRRSSRATILRGACDPLGTPRVLGPLLDIGHQLPARWSSRLVDEAPRPQRFEAFRQLLSERPTLAVIEDVHWADDATLDLLRYVGRRIATTRALLIITLRDDELSRDHPARVLLGDLATAPSVRRIRLAPLSRDAVAVLAADQPVDVDRLHADTGGNPFYVTEVLAAADEEVPGTVRDAVLARAARLTPVERDVLDAAAIVPGGVEPALLTALMPAWESAVDGCVDGGMLRLAGARLLFRHELARLAVASAIPPGKAARLHRRAVAWLAAVTPVDDARVAHHADLAGDGAAVLTHAQRAGRRAAELGSHREAAAYFRRALRYAEQLPADERAEVLEAYARERVLLDGAEDALHAQRRAIALRRELGDRRAEGLGLVQLSHQLGVAGRADASREALDEGLRVLGSLPPGPELAVAYAARAADAMLARELDDAIALGHRAIELAERTGQQEALCRALDAVGCAQLFSGDPAGRATLERNLAIARDGGLEVAVSRVLGNLGSALGEVRAYREAEPYLEEALAFAEAHDLDYYAHYDRAWLARTRFEQGDWDAAGDHARQVSGAPMSRLLALTILGRIRARRGDPGAAEALGEAWELAVRHQDLQRVWPVAAGRAELAWLTGTVALIPELVAPTYDLACQLDHPWAMGELGFWLWRSGQLEALPDRAYEPYRLHVSGQHAAAAEAWGAVGCPYERALALADAGDVALRRTALDEFRRLGAAVDAAALARRLRQDGVGGLPRGTRASTARNPAGLTARQLEVLGLLVQGCSNADIAARLYVSEKTAGHHVSAILRKLGVRSRGEAAHVGAALVPSDLLPPGPTAVRRPAGPGGTGSSGGGRLPGS